MEVQIAVLFNLGVVLIGFWALWRVWSKYRAAKFMEYRFKYFALRDRLGHLATNGILPPESRAYKQMVGMLNAHIRYTERIDLVSFAQGIVRYTQHEHQKSVEELIQTAGEIPELKEIVEDSVLLTIGIIRRHSILMSVCHNVRKLQRLFSWFPQFRQMLEAHNSEERTLERVRAAQGRGMQAVRA